MIATTAAIAAGGWAAAAYLDAKFHFRKDVENIVRMKQGEKEVARVIKEDRVSLFYVLEETCKKRWNEEAIWSREGSYTYGQLYEHTLGYAQYMIDQGIKPKELVAMYLTNSPHFMFVWFATMVIGAAPAFINFNLEGKALLHCLDVCETKLIIVDADQGCQQRIKGSWSEIEAKGMKIAILDESLKHEILSKPAQRPGNEWRNGTEVSFPWTLIYTRSVPRFCNQPATMANT